MFWVIGVDPSPNPLPSGKGAFYIGEDQGTPLEPRQGIALHPLVGRRPGEPWQGSVLHALLLRLLNAPGLGDEDAVEGADGEAVGHAGDVVYYKAFDRFFAGVVFELGRQLIDV